MRFRGILPWALMALALLQAGPTEEREWTSTAGTKVVAKALEVVDGTVKLERANGKTLTVPMDKFVEEDQALLNEHFELNIAKPAGSGTGAATGLPHPVGQIVENIPAGKDSHYHLYLPTSLKDGRKAPLLLFTSAGGGNRRNIELMKEGAELCGWVVAAVVESRNGPGFPDENHKHSKACVEHILTNLPVDYRRFYYTGGSGGGAQAFHNATRLGHAGVICCVGYVPGDVPKGGHYMFINGATDYNRCPSAHWLEELGKDAVQRYHPGGHSLPPAWLMTDAMVWMNGMWLAGKGKKQAGERLDFENALLRWMKKLKETEPWRVFAWAKFLQVDYVIDSENKDFVLEFATELAADENNLKYTEGLEALDEFAREHLSGFGPGSQMNHVTPDITRAAEELAEKYAGVPHIEEVARNLAKESGGQGKK